MNRRAMTALLAVALVAPAAVQAQNPSPRQMRPRQAQPMPDSAQPMQPMPRGDMEPMGMGPRGPGGPERMEALRQQVEERFGRLVQTELQLSDPQMQQVRAAMRASQDRRRDIMRRQQDVQRAIGQQLQPGQAANADSLNRLLNTASQSRVEMAQSDAQFQRDLAFLSPVQRARLMMMTQRLEQRMREIVQQRSGMGPGMGPGMGQGGPMPGQRQRMQRRPI